MAASPSSDSDSNSSRSTSPEPDNKQKQTLKGQAKSKEQVEDSSSSGSESDSDESSDEMDTSEDAPQEKPTSKKITITGPQPYKPPSGFKAATKQTPPSSASSSILSNLKGKKVIHITAPSFLPLSKVKEISMSKILKGKPILSYEGATYGIPAESLNEEDPEGKSLLIFDTKTKTYQKQTDQIPTYHIQELMDVPEADLAAIEALRDTVKPVRPQPKNLKMRFRPVGSLPAPPETLGSDSESEGPSFKAPAAEKERKRKHHHTEAESGETTQAASLPSRKKSKKHSAPENGEEESHKKSKKSKDGEEKKRKKSSKA
ncbi:uncharacterized protein N7483_000281 [Penicillium malachiteum]|uniref:uncharacterized protein n=1 Tax=Penicillium malachiteum TaxID=1324776 RepID=UPI002548C720|nr:uncharacterized protein N7483_000281 [Penicillium malachiteum]KAJ5735156.1 hypothetical protein N7483_000281 [Penicillium malachiteum]